MTTAQIKSRGIALDAASQHSGELVSFTGDTGSQTELNDHLQQHGYLYIPAFLDRSAVEQVRREICE